jgi:DNA-binding MarR family transcriptional regulator
MKAQRLTNIPLVINRVLAGLNNLAARDLAKLGIAPQAARALVVLLQYPQPRCALLSRLLGLEATALSHLLRALSRDHLIVRDRVENDNRAVEVRLTPQGARIAKGCRELALAHERQLLSGLDPQELKALDRILGRLSDNVTPAARRIREGALDVHSNARPPRDARGGGSAALPAPRRTASRRA